MSNEDKLKPLTRGELAGMRDAAGAAVAGAANVSPDWHLGRVDDGEGRLIVSRVPGAPDMDHIRVSTPWARGPNGARCITPEQRDIDASFIVGARPRLVALAGYVEALVAEVDRHAAQLAAWRRVTGCATPSELEAELATLRALVAPAKRRGALMVALATAGAKRVEAARAVDNAPANGPERAAACQRFNNADAAEKAARAALDALEATL